MRKLWINLLIWSCFVSTGLAIRAVSSAILAKNALELVAREQKVPESILSSQTYNYLRGDFRVDLKAPPFRELTWTVNLRTNQLLSWQSKKREDSVLQSLLQNFSKNNR